MAFSLPHRTIDSVPVENTLLWALPVTKQKTITVRINSNIGDVKRL